MRVLNIMLGKGRGGLERASISAHNQLTLAGCQVVSVVHEAFSLRGSFPKDAMTIPVRSFGAWDILTTFRLRRQLRDQHFDVILAHGNRAVLLASRLRALAPLIVVCHTTNYSILKYLHRIDGAIVLTGHYREVLINANYPEDKIRQIPNAIAIGPEPDILPERFVPIIGGLGRLVPNKGVDILIEACVHLKARNVPFQCVIHGVEEDGGVASFVEKRTLANLSETEFSLPGWSEAPDEFLRSVDIFCMPSRREVLSIALLEALAAGRPIVCTRVPGLETAFDDGVEGFFVDVEDSEQLADALELLIRDRGLRLTMGEAARRRAAQFDVKVVGVQLRKALEELTA